MASRTIQHRAAQNGKQDTVIVAARREAKNGRPKSASEGQFKLCGAPFSRAELE
jgi:hypothetical protein